jgi:predicted transcriptional regulator
MLRVSIMTATSQNTKTTKITTIKLDESTKSRLQALANARERTPHWLILKAISEYVEREEKQETFRLSAIAIYEHYCETGLHVTHAEADAWLAKLEAGEDSEPPVCHD